jgi:hypothetical protein
VLLKEKDIEILGLRHITHLAAAALRLVSSAVTLNIFTF